MRILARLVLRVGGVCMGYENMCSVGLVRVVGDELAEEVGTRW